MNNFGSILADSLQALISLDSGLWEIILLSLKVSLMSVTVAVVIGLPLGALLAVRQFPGRSALTLLVETMMSFPPVVVGLIVYVLLSQASPLGVFGLLYTPTAMVIAQALLITPLMIALSRQTFAGLWQRLGEQLLMLHLPSGKRMAVLLYEARGGFATISLAGFGRAISEIGTVMIVGGNIEHHTRVMTTAIAQETSKGNLAEAMALGILLMLIALLVNLLLYFIRRRGWSG